MNRTAVLTGCAIQLSARRRDIASRLTTRLLPFFSTGFDFGPAEQ